MIQFLPLPLHSILARQLVWPGFSYAKPNRVTLYLLIPLLLLFLTRIKSRSACISLIKSVNAITRTVEADWVIACLCNRKRNSGVPILMPLIRHQIESEWVCQNCGHSPIGFLLETITDLNKFTNEFRSRAKIKINLPTSVSSIKYFSKESWTVFSLTVLSYCCLVII